MATSGSPETERTSRRRADFAMKWGPRRCIASLGRGGARERAKGDHWRNSNGDPGGAQQSGAAGEKEEQGSARRATSGSPETERTSRRRADFAPTTKRPRFRTTAVCSILDATIITPPAGDFISTLSRFFLTVSHIRTNLPERPEPFGQTITFVSAISAKVPS